MGQAAAVRGDVAQSEMRCGRHRLRLGERTLVMGVINMTPDSFSGDGLGDSVETAVALAKAMAAAGADLLDVGGESTRPGSSAVPAEEQIRRTEPAIRAIVAEVDVPVSIDATQRAVAEAALDAGATIINDISALRFDDDMAPLAAERGVPVVLMHMQGTPQTMQQAPHYDDVVGEIGEFLRERTARAVESGIDLGSIILDPGIGFGKTLDHNLEILRRLRELKELGRPLLIGTSRKSMVRSLVGQTDTTPEVVMGTAATVAISIQNGADIVRVHDVADMVPVVRVTDAIARGWRPPA